MLLLTRPGTMHSLKTLTRRLAGQGTRSFRTSSRASLLQPGFAERGSSPGAFFPPDLLSTHPPQAQHTQPSLYPPHARGEEYWRKIERWSDVSPEHFLTYQWQTVRSIKKKDQLIRFLEEVLPERIPQPRTQSSQWSAIKTRDDFIADVEEGMKMAPMAVRLTPHMLSVADWNNPIEDPIRRQFIPMKTGIKPDHPSLSLDSLHETADSPVPGLVHRYPDKVLFLANSVCPVYCRFCTRSYAVGDGTQTITKASQKPQLHRWEKMFQYIEQNPQVQDVVVSGGDSYFLPAHQLELIGERLLSIPHVQRFRFATKGLAVCPMRILDRNDTWTEAFVSISDKGRAMGKQVAMHTHFNHPNEITWVTQLAARELFKRGVTVRNQSVLLRGINDNVETMSTFIRKLADLNIMPYYVYQSDLVRGIEDLRTPLSTILELEKNIRGTIAGFMMPQFIVDLPAGGGKRLANSYETYDPESGLSTWQAPGVAGDEVFKYFDPIKDETEEEDDID